MKQEESAERTVILNRNNDGFLDLSSSDELREVIRALNRINGESHDEQ